MNKLAAFLLMLLLFAGCPQEGNEAAPQVKSLAIESQEHIFSKTYKVFAELSPDAFNSTNSFVLYEGEKKIASQPLAQEAPQGNQLSVEWSALDVGEHTLSALIEDENGTAISDSKTLEIEAIPLGFYEFQNQERSYPVETAVWCAQEFTLENEVPLSKIEAHLRSLVPTREGKTVSLEIRKTAGTNPMGAEEGLVAAASLPAASIKSKAEWVSFGSYGKIPAGTYFLVLKRDDTVGNIAWTYSNEGNGIKGICRDLNSGGGWNEVEGTFAFRIQ